ncbi:MAG: type II CAAX prenyl endopeptidase Rce1 family protein [Aquificaceae bacterium]
MFIRRSTELLLYGLLIFNILLHRLFQMPNLSTLILLLPLAFLPSERFGVKSRWNLSLLLLPLLYLIHPQNFLSLLIQAFAEELFFRAYLMQSFSPFLVSLMFALPHFILYTDLWSLLTFFPSLLYCYIYQRTNSLALVSLLHLASNIAWFRVIIFLIPF